MTEAKFWFTLQRFYCKMHLWCFCCKILSIDNLIKCLIVLQLKFMQGLFVIIWINFTFEMLNIRWKAQCHNKTEGKRNGKKYAIFLAFNHFGWCNYLSWQNVWKIQVRTHFERFGILSKSIFACKIEHKKAYTRM